MEMKSNNNNYDVQLFQPKFFYNPKSTISTAIRDTSCSRGWLRLVVQCIFGIITVTSFILIVIMSLRPTNTASDKISDNIVSKCVVSNCKIQCSQAPYYDRYENEIVYAVKQASSKCDGVGLTLNRPIFINNTLPLNWLGYVESKVHYLEIVGGNLNNVRPDTFITPFTRNLKVLIFEDIQLADWDPDMLVGLSLVEFQIRHCTISGIRRNALRTVDDTLRNLVISLSGDWDPANITGTIPLPYLTSVDFSFNIFTNILSRMSFPGLSSCEILYLNSCKITAISRGTFDFLVNIKIIYLNNNFLITLPQDIFMRITNIVTPTPRFDLQDNPWNCNCSFFEIMQLSSQGTLLVDPICKDPEEHRGKSFSQMERYCNKIYVNDTLYYSTNDQDKSLANQIIKNYIYANGLCNDYSERSSTPLLISPVPEYSCLPNNTLKAGMLEYVMSNSSRPKSSNSSLLRPSFFIKSAHSSVIEISCTESKGYGLVWFHSNCPNEVHCVNLLPNFLRLYDVNMSGSYTFCSVNLSSGVIESDACIGFDAEETNSSLTRAINITRLILYIVTSFVSLIFGAICVYAVIIKNPTLLKGSKRVLFVKHKQVDALVLPPKLPLRNNLLTEQYSVDFKDKSIFITPGNCKQYTPNMFVRGNSKRSTKSNAPSYISAIHPTEDQLKEWRLQHHFDKNSTITSLSSDISTYSWILNEDSVLCPVDVLAYDSLK